LWELEAVGTGRRRASSQQLTGFFGSCCLEGDEKIEELWGAGALGVVMMHPSSKQRVFWDLAGLLLIGYDCIMVPLDMFQLPQTAVLDVMAWIIRLYWTFNMVMSFLVGYMRDDGMVEMRPFKVARRYLISWFPLDAFIVSFDWAELLAAGFSGSSVNKLGSTLRGLRMVRTVRLFRLLKAPEMTNKLAEYIPMSEQLGLIATIAKIMFFFLWITHVVACLWFGLGLLLSKCGDGCQSWIEAEEDSEGRVPIELSLSEKYTMSFHWSLAAFSGDTSLVLPHNMYERIYAMLVLFLAFVVSASVVGGITTSMTRLQIILSEQTSKLTVLRRFLIDHHISRPLAVRVQRNAQHAMLEEKTKAPESSVELLRIISQPVLVEVHFEIHSRVLLTHPFMLAYNDINPAGMRRVCHSAISMTSLHTKDILFSDLEYPEEPKMFFITGGKLLYQQSRKAPAFLEKGVWMCEPNLWTMWHHFGSLRAVSESRLLVLDALKFQDIISSFPSDHAGLYALEFVDWLNEMLDKGVDMLTDRGPDREASAEMVYRAFPDDEDDEDLFEETRTSNRGSAQGVFRRAATSVWNTGREHAPAGFLSHVRSFFCPRSGRGSGGSGKAVRRSSVNGWGGGGGGGEVGGGAFGSSRKSEAIGCDGGQALSRKSQLFIDSAARLRGMAMGRWRRSQECSRDPVHEITVNQVVPASLSASEPRAAGGRHLGGLGEGDHRGRGP